MREGFYMKVSEILNYLRNNPGLSLNEASKRLGIDYNSIKTVAKIGGIELATRRRMREICNNAPESCFTCPFSDCICNKQATIEETKFALAGIGDKDAHFGQSTKKRRKKRKKGGENNADR